jgi:hypothetical protein
MAYSISSIQDQILTSVASQPVLSGLTSPSEVSIYNLWSYITAVGINIEQNLWDNFQAQLETQILAAPIGTDSWLNSQVFLFQYNATTPQIVTLNSGFTPSYPVINVADQIITRASVITQQNRIVQVKVATSNPPQALSSLQLSSLQSYLNTISFCGVQYNTVSLPADYLLLGATIYYNGQYGSTIQQTCLNAFNNYMANVPFDGYVVVSQIEAALLAVPGVEDVVLNNVAIRPNSVPLSNTLYLVQNDLEIQRRSSMYSGYCINESSPNDFLSLSVFISQ